MNGVLDYALHYPGGAMFLWACFESLHISARQLYDRLRIRGIIVVPGEPFFFGFAPEDDDWPHRKQCIRISFAMFEATLAVAARSSPEKCDVGGRSAKRACSH